MKPPFYYEGHHKMVAEKILKDLNNNSNFMSPHTLESTRAVGDAIESIISEKFNNFLGDWCIEYSNDFARRAMADLAFKDKYGFYSVIDVKTHRENTDFNMPNLTSVKRLSEFYEDDRNVFSLVMVKYNISNNQLNITEVIFTPIEFINWDCLTIGALGWGQIQISNSNNINLHDRYSRKEWMLEFCNIILNFYPGEIAKINDRVNKFNAVKNDWQSKKDSWQ